MLDQEAERLGEGGGGSVGLHVCARGEEKKTVLCRVVSHERARGGGGGVVKYVPLVYN